MGSLASRAVTWLARWIPLMSLWVALGDSLAADELLAGAGAAAIAAPLAETACHQAGLLFRVRLHGVPRRGARDHHPVGD
jgi:hypothetical protein